MPKTILEMKRVSGMHPLGNQLKFGHYIPRHFARERSIGRRTREVVRPPFRKGMGAPVTGLVPLLNTSLFLVEQIE